MQYIKICVLIISACTSYNLQAMTEYVPQPLTHLNVTQGVSKNGIMMAVSPLNQNDLKRLFGFYADVLAKDYIFIQSTVLNQHNTPYVIDADNFDLPLANTASLINALNSFIKTNAANRVFSSLIALLMTGNTQAYIAPNVVKGGNVLDYLLARLETRELGLPQITTDIAFGGALAGGPAGKMMLAFGFSPLVIGGTAAANIYGMYKLRPLIKRDIEGKVLEPHGKKTIPPHATESFLLIVPKQYAALVKEKIK